MDYITDIINYQPVNEEEAEDRRVMLSYIRDFPNILTRENKYAHFTASSWIVNQDSTKVLMIYHNIYRSWSWTGGHADGEADLLKTAEREAMEETGIRSVLMLSDSPVSLEIICVDGHRKNNAYVSSHLHLNLTYLFQADDSQPLKIKEDENSGVRWIPIEESVALCEEACMKKIYEKLKRRISAFSEKERFT